MICRLKGNLFKKSKNFIVIERDGVFYQVDVSENVCSQLKEVNHPVELVIYHYFNITGNKSVPVLIGFIDELEKEFFEKFISVSGVGPKAALRAFDKPISLIAQAIERADLNFLTNLAGIGKQRARQIVASLQGKVGRFALLKGEPEQTSSKQLVKDEVIQEAKQVLKRLQYSLKEIDKMIKKAMLTNSNIQDVETLLNEIYKQKNSGS